MAFFRGTFLSEVLECETSLQVMIPWDLYDFRTHDRYGRCDKTLILLHGLRQSGDDWIRMTNVARYAEELGFCLVIPELQRRFCTDMRYGMRYFTYITQELSGVVDALFKIPVDRAHLYVGGLSMGGFGALKCALKYPERYAGAICLSSALYHLLKPEVCLGDSAAYGRGELQGILGIDLQASGDEDLRHLAQLASGSEYKPAVYMSCGDQDCNYGENMEMCRHLEQLGFPARFEGCAGGHYWDVWDTGIRRGMEYMLNQKQ